jgi:hypothetical protein
LIDSIPTIQDRVLATLARHPRTSWCLSTLLALALAWRRFLSGRHSPFASDIEQYHHPVTRELVRAWSEGRIPLWTDRVYLGFPYLADPQTAAWYPGTLLVAWLGPHYGYTIFLFLHSLLACAGMTGLVRSHGGSFGAGWTAGLVVALSGFFAIEAQHPGLFAILCWVPAGLWTLHRLFDGPTPQRFAAAALVLALMIFAGTLQVLFGVVIVYGFYLAGLAIDASRAHGWRNAARCAGAVIGSQLLGLGLAAVVLLPATAHLSQTARALGMSYAFGSMGSVHPLQLLGAFSNTAELGLGAGLELGFDGASLFLGGLTLPLAIVGLARTRSALGSMIALGVVVCGFLVLGRFGWLHPFLYDAFPGSIGSLRGVGRALGPASILLALLMGLGLHALARPDENARRLLTALLAGALGVQALVWWSAATPLPSAALGSHLVLLSALVLAWLCRRNSRTLQAGLIVLAALDLVGAASAAGTS